MRPQPPAADTPPPSPASLRTSSNLGALGVLRRVARQGAGDNPGVSLERGRRREAARAKLEAGREKANEPRAGQTEAPGGVSRPGGDTDGSTLRPAGPRARGGARELAAPLSHAKQRWRRGARPGAGPVTLGFSPFAFLRVFSSRDTNLETAAGWARPRPAGREEPRRAGPATVRPRRPPSPDTPPGRSQKRPKFAGRDSQP